MIMAGNRKKICLKANTVGEHSTNDNPTSEILDDDCLLHVFEYLPISDRVRLERVNKRWHAVSKKSWQRCKTLTFVNDLWGCQNELPKVTKKALKKVLRLCGKYLKVLDMSITSVLAEKVDISSLLKHCPNLTSADFRSITVGVPLIKSLVEYCENIVVLHIRGKTSCVTIQLINDTVLSTYTNLQILKMEDLYFHEDCLEFKNNDAIQELHLEYCIDLNVHNFDAITQLRNLHTLSLKASLNLADLDFNRLSNVVKLDISYNFLIVDDNFMIKIANLCARLTSLNVTGNDYVTDKGLRAAISSSKLEFLEINYLKLVTGSSLLDLPYLKKLSCQYCTSIEDVHIQTLFVTSKKLEYIDLRGIRNVSGIIRQAVKIVKFRTNDVLLVMFVDEVDVSITDIPDSCKLIPAGRRVIV